MVGIITFSLFLLFLSFLPILILIDIFQHPIILKLLDIVFLNYTVQFVDRKHLGFFKNIFDLHLEVNLLYLFTGLLKFDETIVNTDSILQLSGDSVQYYPITNHLFNRVLVLVPVIFLSMIDFSFLHN